MKPGDSIEIQATVLRVEGNRVDAQTLNGQLIQTDVTNVVGLVQLVDFTIVVPSGNKAVKNSPENKSSKSK